MTDGPESAPDSAHEGVAPHSAIATRHIALVDLLDRLLSGGVVVTGEVTLCVADVELVRISLRLLLSSVSTLALGSPGPAEAYTDAKVQ